MALLWLLSIGFVLCLGLAGGVIIYFIKTSLNSEDSNRIDPLPKKDE